MASKTTAAAQRKVAATKAPAKKPAAKKPAFKGKYPGPDKYKGKPPPKPAAKPKAAPKVTAPKAPDPTQTDLYEEPDPGNTVSNSSGTIDLQTNYDLNKDADDANAEYAEIEAETGLTKQQAEIQKAARKLELKEQSTGAIGQNNAMLAARGMTGDVAQRKVTELGDQINEETNKIDTEASTTSSEADTRLALAKTRKDQRLAGVATGQLDYTNSRSATAPTVGSKPVSSGVTSTTLPTKAAAAPAAPKAPAKKAAAKPKFKGKYAGPDVFKGDAKKNAAWRKAGKPKIK